MADESTASDLQQSPQAAILRSPARRAGACDASGPDLRRLRPGHRRAVLGRSVGFAATLLSAGVVALLTVWAAFAAFRDHATGDAAADRPTGAYAIAFATFILLLGLGLTPLPGGGGEALASRLLNVLLASAYAVGAVSVMQRWPIGPRSKPLSPISPGPQ
jgi:hypothetical protein